MPSLVRTDTHRVACSFCRQYHRTAESVRSCQRDMEAEAAIDRYENDRMFAEPPIQWEP